MHLIVAEPVVCVITTAETEDSASNLCAFRIHTEYRIEIIFIVGKSNRLTIAMYSYYPTHICTVINLDSIGCCPF